MCFCGAVEGTRRSIKQSGEAQQRMNTAPTVMNVAGMLVTSSERFRLKQLVIMQEIFTVCWLLQLLA